MEIHANYSVKPVLLVITWSSVQSELMPGRIINQRLTQVLTESENIPSSQFLPDLVKNSLKTRETEYHGEGRRSNESR